MQASGKLQFGPGEEYNFTSENLCDLGEIGRGAFGAVNKMTFEDKGIQFSLLCNFKFLPYSFYFALVTSYGRETNSVYRGRKRTKTIVDGSGSGDEVE
jgi:hypothetical protein